MAPKPNPIFSSRIESLSASHGCGNFTNLAGGDSLENHFAARAGNLHPQAWQFLQSYLSSYDSDWMLQAQGQAIPPPTAEGTHRYEARIQLVETMRALNKIEEAKRNVEHILRLAKGEDVKSKEIAGDARMAQNHAARPEKAGAKRQRTADSTTSRANESRTTGRRGPKRRGRRKRGRMDHEPWHPASAMKFPQKLSQTHPCTKSRQRGRSHSNRTGKTRCSPDCMERIHRRQSLSIRRK